MRRSWNWTEFQIDKLNKTIEILNDLREYKPLTLRQVYYQLVGKGYIENNKSQYTMLSGLLKWARIDKYISWNDIEDRTRSFHDLEGWNNKDDFISDELDIFLKGYRRDIMQSQDNYIEIWIEKDALSSIFTRTASPYGVNVVVCRGFTSVSFLNEFKSRIENQAENKNVIMLYFGDFDPSGNEMLKSMEVTLANELNIKDIEYKRVALMLDDISKHRLPHNPDAIKRKDTRTQKHVEAYGHIAVELDALPPGVLVEKIKNAIEQVIDITEFNKEIKLYNNEVDKLNTIKEITKKYFIENIL